MRKFLIPIFALLLSWSCSAAMTDNLVSYWKLDEASGNALDAHSTNDLTDNNTVTAGTGIINGARDFEAGNQEYFNHADNAALSTGDIDFSVACWVKMESKTQRMEIAGKGSAAGGSANQFEWSLVHGDDGDFFEFQGSNGTATWRVDASNFGAPSTGVWYYVVAWHDSVNNVVGICVNDGTPNTASYSGGSWDSTFDFYIGLVYATTRTWDGLIDEFGFWKKVLSASEITFLYNSGAGRAYPFTGGAVRQPRPPGGLNHIEYHDFVLWDRRYVSRAA